MGFESVESESGFGFGPMPVQLILLSMIQVLFFSRVKSTGTYNNIAYSAIIDNLLTLLHVRSDISYIEGFDGSDIDDLIKLVATL